MITQEIGLETTQSEMHLVEFTNDKRTVTKIVDNEVDTFVDTQQKFTGDKHNNGAVEIRVNRINATTGSGISIDISPGHNKTKAVFSMLAEGSYRVNGGPLITPDNVIKLKAGDTVKIKWNWTDNKI